MGVGYQDQERGWWDESASPAAAGPHGVSQPQAVYAVDASHPNARDEGFDWDKLARVIVAVLLPPLGVFFATGCNKDLAINVLLTLLGYIPGIIHAIYVIFKA